MYWIAYTTVSNTQGWINLEKANDAAIGPDGCLHLYFDGQDQQVIIRDPEEVKEATAKLNTFAML